MAAFREMLSVIDNPIAAVEQIALQEGIAVEAQSYSDGFKDIVQISKRIPGTDGETEKYGIKVSIDYDPATSDEDILRWFEYQVQNAIRAIRAELEQLFEVNGHEIVVYSGDGFCARDRITGESWEVTERDISRYSFYHGSRGALIEKLMLYVLGWATTHSPDEIFDQRYLQFQ